MRARWLKQHNKRTRVVPDFVAEAWVEEDVEPRPRAAWRPNGIQLASRLPHQEPVLGPYEPLCRLHLKNLCNSTAPELGALCRFHASPPATDVEAETVREMAWLNDSEYDPSWPSEAEQDAHAESLW